MSKYPTKEQFDGRELIEIYMCVCVVRRRIDITNINDNIETFCIGAVNWVGIK